MSTTARRGGFDSSSSRRASSDKAAEGAGIAKSALSQSLAGTYPTNGPGACTVDATLRKLDEWLRKVEAIGEAPQRG